MLIIYLYNKMSLTNTIKIPMYKLHECSECKIQFDKYGKVINKEYFCKDYGKLEETSIELNHYNKF